MFYLTRLLKEFAGLSSDSPFRHDCFVCKHSVWNYYYEVPVVQNLSCSIGHRKTSYNTPYNKEFVCEDYQHSYFVKSYYGMWWYIFWGNLFVILFIIWGLK